MLKVTVIDQVEPTNNPLYRKQIVDVHVGKRHPIESNILLGEKDAPLAAGEYVCNSYNEKGYDLVVDLARRTLVKAK